jgi:hypothetical protein
MKKYLLTTLLITFFLPLLTIAQVKDTLTQTQTQSYNPPSQVVQKEREPNRIKAGFYIKLGPVFPMGSYGIGQTLQDTSSVPAKRKSDYLPAKMGAAIDLGYLIYIGPAFANNHLRLGIDACFISFSFNPVNGSTKDSSATKYWYYFIGQKFGPVISICPIDRLVIDISYKMNAYMGYVNHHIRGDMKDEWGKNLTQSEISMSIRYSLILFSFQYNFGKCTYNDFDVDKPIHKVDNSTFRIMIGFKF